MKWPWKSDTEPTHEGLQALESARKSKRVAEARQPVVNELERWITERREANHLQELFFELRGGKSHG